MRDVQICYRASEKEEEDAAFRRLLADTHMQLEIMKRVKGEYATLLEVYACYPDTADASKDIGDRGLIAEDSEPMNAFRNCQNPRCIMPLSFALYSRDKGDAHWFLLVRENKITWIFDSIKTDVKIVMCCSRKSSTIARHRV